MLPIAPAALYLLYARADNGSKASKAFLSIVAVSVVVFCFFNATQDVPMYLRRYEADEKAGKTYLPFVPGLRDAWSRRVVTKAYEDWHADMFWMTAYFTLAAWSGLLLMFAPRPAEEKRSDPTKIQPLLPPQSA